MNEVRIQTKIILMDNRVRIGSCLIWLGIGILLQTGTSAAVAYGEIDIGSYHSSKACREDNVTFTWMTEDNVTNLVFFDLMFSASVVINGTNNRVTTLSYLSTGKMTIHDRYKGRLFLVAGGPQLYRFRLENVNPKDRGIYELLIVASSTYRGSTELIVYAEDNLWPVASDDNPESVQNEEDVQPTSYHYPFIRHDQSPVIGIKMALQNYDIAENCHFGNQSRCDITFTKDELYGVYGTVKFDVTPLFENNTVMCDAVKKSYDYKITIMTAKLSSALVGGICVSVFIAVAACVIPPVIIYIKKKRENFIPLKDGYNFLKGCIDRIEETDDISDVYRKNANSKMIHPHIQGYFEDPKSREGFFQDEGITKIYFAAFIKHYIKHVKEPLISLEYIEKIKSDGTSTDEKDFNVTEAKNAFAIRKQDSKNTKYRKNILRLLFQHFSWFRQRKIEADGSDSEENSPSKILTLGALAGFLSMNLDRSESTIVMEDFEKLGRLTRFLKGLIVHCEEVFGSREDANGTADKSMDMTTKSLLSDSFA